MKEVIKEVRFVKEIDGKFGKQYMFEVQYDNKRALYYSRDKEQKNIRGRKRGRVYRRRKVLREERRGKNLLSNQGDKPKQAITIWESPEERTNPIFGFCCLIRKGFVCIR